MIEIKKTIDTLTDEEICRAAEAYGPLNHSNHESYAVILEEYEEAVREMMEFHSQLGNFWDAVKADKGNTIENANQMREYLRRMKNYAQYGACEWVQVAAMCVKATKTIDNLKDEDET